LPGFIFHIIESRLNQPRVRNHHLDARAQLTLVPGLPQLRGNVRGQYSHLHPFFRQDALQPACHISFLGVNRVHLHLPAVLQRRFHFLHQPSFLGVDKVLIQIASLCDQERLTALGFRIELAPHQVPETEGPVRVSEESI
jgi:hypothetical protein